MSKTAYAKYRATPPGHCTKYRGYVILRLEKGCSLLGRDTEDYYVQYRPALDMRKFSSFKNVTAFIDSALRNVKVPVTSAMNGAVVMESIDTPYGCSVGDEAYWAS